jgi:pimeloyl-ACP methyl ester carboxylesterase
MAREEHASGRTGRALLGAGVVAGAAAGLAGAAYAIERAVVAGVRRRPDPDAGKPLVPPFDEAVRYPSHDGGSVYTISRGKGAPILFSHGVTLSTRVWVKQFEALPEQRFRCIGFDHRGHGDSECGDSGHSIGNLAEDVRTVLERMDLHDAVLVGHSMGGIALQAFASHYPEVAAERVRGMVLMSSLAKTYLSGASWLRKTFERLTGGGPSAGDLMTQQNLGFFLARVGFGRDPQASHVELVREMIAACPKAASQEAVTALVGLDMTDELPRIRVPTLVLSGSADVIARGAGAAHRRAHPRSTPRGVQGRRPHAHARAHRRGQRASSRSSHATSAPAPLRRFWPRRRSARRVRAALAPREAAS